MARIETITNKIDLLAFIYHRDTLPTAIFNTDENPDRGSSVHAMREGEEKLVDLVLEKMRVNMDESGKFGNAVKAYRFHEDYPQPNKVCYGTFFTRGSEERRVLRDIEEWATKTFEQCA